ncbi:MAG: DUF2062 domain-containing protein [Kiritimatiellae bacterium]|nr:DUF2062 domain-containing protein [Kiritimatiellia bacterium]
MKKLLAMIQRLLREGLNPEGIALAVALGLTIGVFPIYSPMSLMVILLAWLLKLNKPLALAAYYSMTFVMPLLIIPFLRLGEWAARAEMASIHLIELSKRFTAAPMETLQEFGWSFAHAVFGWALMAPVLTALLYALILLLGRRWQERGRDPVNPMPEDDGSLPVEGI